MLKVSDVRKYFISELKAGRFTIDRTGAKTIEMVGASFLADEDAIFGKVNWEYVKSEIEWYESQSSNIYDLADPPPKVWEYTANEHGEINSNYGMLIYSEKYYDQYYRALQTLLENRDTRRCTMIYTRPSILVEAKEHGKNDFICTNAVSYYIRGRQLNAVVQMRSNDVVFGYKNDLAWQNHVLRRLVDDYNDDDRNMYKHEVVPGSIIWQVQNLHVYERHFHLVK